MPTLRQKALRLAQRCERRTVAVGVAALGLAWLALSKAETNLARRDAVRSAPAPKPIANESAKPDET